MVDSTELLIRRAVEADLPALEWDGEYTHFRKVYQHAFREAQRDRRLIFLAETDGKVIGQLFVHLHSVWKSSFNGVKTGYFHSFRVKPGFRNQGVGSDLLRVAEDALTDRGYACAIISVAQVNTGAQRLYQQRGYTVYREDPGEWSYVDHNGKVKRISEPAYVMVKTLSALSPSDN